MKIGENLYKMSLVGASGGLSSWAVGPLVPLFISELRTIPQERYWITQTIDVLLIGFFIGVFCISFAAYWSDQRMTSKRLFGSLLGGCIAGGLAGLLVYLVHSTWSAESDPLRATLLAWSVTGASIGLALGVIRYGLLLRRLFLSLLGGAIGGVAGGCILLILGERLPYLTHAFGLMMTGAGVAYGSASAVVIMRNAQVRFLESDDPEVIRFLSLRKQEHELLRGDHYVFGRLPEDSVSRKRQRFQYIHIPDENMAPLHAEIFESGKSFYLKAHESNRGPRGSAYALKLTDPKTGKARDVVDVELLESGAEILMGRTKFRFALRGKTSVLSRAKTTGMFIWLALVFWPQTMFAQSADNLSGARFVSADKVRLLQCEPSSERPAFRVTANVVDREGNILKIQGLDLQKRISRVQAYEGDSRLEVINVVPTFNEDNRPPRIAVLLVDVSGSMLEPAGDGRTKFDVMKEACAQFAKDFDGGIDQVAVIPFDSRKVVYRVNNAIFCRSKQELDLQIRRIPLPTDANTGLYSALQAAVTLLRERRDQAISKGFTNPQCLLVVMTDGRNDVGKEGDDPDLLTDWKPVRSLAEAAGFPVITVGFGDSRYIDEASLKRLAWRSQNDYIPARNSSELVRAFQTARIIQIERVQITFFPKQSLRGQLVKQHEFRVLLDLDANTVVEGTFVWAYSGIGAPPFEGVLAPGECGSLQRRETPLQLWFIYVATLLIFGGLIMYLWFKVPRRIWADEYDTRLLLPLALSILNCNTLKNKKSSDGSIS